MKFTYTLAVILLMTLSCTENNVGYYGVFKEAGPEQIKPQGWLEEALRIQKEGLGTHYQNSGYPYDTGLWACDIPKGGNPIAKGWWPYEQCGYLVDGIFRCGLFLDDDSLIELGKENCRYVLEHPRENGMIGPEKLGENQWAISVFSRAMMAYYSLTKDNAVLDTYKNHFANLPDSLETRQTCIIESMCKVYSYTNDDSVLHHAEKIWNDFTFSPDEISQCFADRKMRDSLKVQIHGVTAAEVAKQPAILYLYTGKERYLDEASGFFAAVERDHELVDGIPSSDEKMSGNHSTALHETCDISDFLWSYGYMMMATGQAKWGDKMESALVNAAFGALGKDFKTHQYFSSPNQIYATHESSAASYGEEGKLRQAYRPGFDTECCSGNVHRMIPNFVSRCWMTTNDGDGAVAALLTPSTFTFQKGKNKIIIDESTDYPYKGKIRFKLQMEKPERFPLLIRIPGWANGTSVSMNGGPSAIAAAGKFFVIKKKFKNGDIIEVDIPLKPRLESSNAGKSASIFLGPVLYSLKIDEKEEKVVDGMKTSEEYPAWNVRWGSSWNYAIEKDAPIAVDTTTIPYELAVIVHEIPSWKDDGLHTPGLPQEGFEVKKDSVIVRMVPSGTTRIRMVTLPLTESSDLAMRTKIKAEKLMQEWADGLLSLKVDDILDYNLAGNFLCPACAAMHGRIIDIVWPMTWLWSQKGDPKYLKAAIDAVQWGKNNLQMSDGSYLNDPNHLWRGITVFSQISLGKALLYGNRLPDDVRQEWRTIFDKQTKYIYDWMSNPDMVVNVNYRAAYPLAMELAYKLTQDEKYRDSAKIQAKRVLECISDDSLLFGESKPMDIISPRGYRSVDIGYNMEESLPSMLEYAEMAGEDTIINSLIKCAKEHMSFILPDGGIDNSFGCRACKWTYWGSRTSDGILPMLSVLARNGVKEALHAADLTLDLYTRLTDGKGLLSGGIYYSEACEPTCIHHTFCHLKSLPGWIDSDFSDADMSEAESILSEISFGVRSYPSCGVHLIGTGPWRATFSCNDYTFSGQKEHSTGGGSMTLLYHKDLGLILAATIAKYSIVESMNMQEQRNDGTTLCFTPRIQNGSYWSVLDDKAKIRINSENDIRVHGQLTNELGSRKGGKFDIKYNLFDDEVRIRINAEKTADYILPVISGPDDLLIEHEKGFEICKSTGSITIESDSPISKITTGRPDGLAFNPVAGLMSNYFVINMTPGICSEVKIRVK